MQTRRITLLAILLALSVVINIVERVALNLLTTSLGFLFAPLLAAGGIRIGFANIVVMTVLYTYGIRDSFTLLILRVFLVGLVFTGLFSLPFYTGLMGGIVAFFLMVIMKHFKGFSLISVSVMGAVGHVFGQIFVAIIIFQQLEIIIYIPILLLIAVPAGMFTGKLTLRVIEYIKPYLIGTL